MLEQKEEVILDFIKKNPRISSKDIHNNVASEMSYATVKRIISALVKEQLVNTQGIGRATTYSIVPNYSLLHPLDVDAYFQQDLNERNIFEQFNFDLIEEVLTTVNLFTKEENRKLDKDHIEYRNNLSELSNTQYRKELERLAIDLSWKSSQIEGNTYSLLETEQLLKDKISAENRTPQEATMLLNHKEALDFIIDHPDYLSPLTISKIEDIHSILIKELGVSRNIRNRRVGITGTNYRPLDNEFQIREALASSCKLINNKENVFEKALLLLVLLSYIQPFEDGNKRTARIVSNAILISNGYCPLSFRSVNSLEYKKAMLTFYEQNNITAFKKIFIEQYTFAVNAYF